MSTMTDKRTEDFLATSIKGLLQYTMEWMEARNTELLEQAGVVGTPAEIKLFASLRGRERTISELSRALGVTRQSVHNTVHKLVNAGLVQLTPSPNSKRDKLVVVTDQGQETRKLAAKNLRQIEQELAQRIGKQDLESLRAILLKHHQHSDSK